MVWQWAQARNRFSEVVNRALRQGPQRIACRGGVVILMSEAHYQQAIGERPGFARYLCAGPTIEGLDLQRDQSAPRRGGDL